MADAKQPRMARFCGFQEALLQPLPDAPEGGTPGHTPEYLAAKTHYIVVPEATTTI